MITAVIVLAVVAFALGAFIAIDIFRGKKKSTVKSVVPQNEKAQEPDAESDDK